MQGVFATVNFAEKVLTFDFFTKKKYIYVKKN